jgi:hypothetical protein
VNFPNERAKDEWQKDELPMPDLQAACSGIERAAGISRFAATAAR